MVNASLTFLKICDNLNGRILQKKVYKENQKIERVKLFDSSQDQFDHDTVYIGTMQDYILIRDYELNAILCSDTESSTEEVFHPGANIVVLQSSNVAKTLSDVLDMFFHFNKVLTVYHEFMKTILEEDPLQTVVDKCEKVLQNPVAVMDSSFKLLAWTKDTVTKDNYWKEILENGYPSLATITAVQKANGYKSFLQPCIIEPECKGNVRKILIRLQSGKSNLGYMAILEENHIFTDYDLELIKLISKIMAKLLSDQNTETNKCDNDRYEQMIIDILEDGQISENQLQKRLPYLKWNFSDRYYLLTIDITGQDNFDTLSCYIKNAVRKRYPRCNLLLYNRQIIIIDGLAAGLLEPEESYLNPLKIILAKSGLRGGISNVFSNLVLLKTYYNQSLLALELGEAVQKDITPLSYYRNYALQYMIRVCSRHADLKYFCHPAVIQLYEYDQTKHTHYLETLEAFLKYNKNSYAAAEAIYIHRNTLVYRINKIKEITGLNLDEHEDLSLMVSLEICKYEKL
ncbi:helix-turn-helix domain-containing protein [Anaerocolumna sp. AGMB13025]|uniref:PucR family transcriptional regulator n=1 Tax=Anaerocolumna sp. AGMB13025 TaxID=3039116 RepID=UPI00241EF074|nr:helix-turn-helix domain-containing protein [Anaerocolumna sp. AGMB13025]WFR56885.1 helix-turn-helix domain-containing protein [Anaerocolumna sp. AGMB13025]